MSQWTHINASIRFDGIEELTGIISEKELGIISTWDNEKETDFMPCGSEGGIEYTIVKTGIENSIASRVVVFTGDLRDYDDVEEVLFYFNKIIKGQMVRSGILEIEVDSSNLNLYRVDHETNKWIKV